MKTILKNYFATIKKHTAVTILNILGLAAAFIACMLILMQVSFEFGYDKFRPSADRIYQVEFADKESPNQYMGYITRPDFENISRLSPSIVKAGAKYNMDIDYKIVFGENKPDESFIKVPFSFVTADYPATLEMEIISGTGTLSDPSSAIIPLSMAKQVFGKEDAVGQPIKIVGDLMEAISTRRNYQVVGVYRDIPGNSMVKNDVYASLGDWGQGNINQSNLHSYLKLDNPLSAGEIAALLKNYEYESWYYKESLVNSRLHKLSDIYFAEDMTSQLTGNYKLGNKKLTLIFLMAGILILGIALVNYFNFMVSQTPLRIRSINIQKVLGSSLFILRGGMILESVLFCLVAYGLALIGLYWADSSSLLSFIQADMTLSGTGNMLLAGLGASVLIGILIGIYPAIYATSLPPGLTLRGSFGLSFKGKRLRTTLVGFQYIISIGMIIMAVFMNLQYRLLRQEDMGFNRDQVLTVELTSALSQKRMAVKSELEKNASINDVSFAMTGFFGDKSMENWIMQDGKDPSKIHSFNARFIDDNFMSLLDIKIIEGRNFLEGDMIPESRSILINRKAQTKYGLQVGDMLNGTSKEIVGIFDDIRYRSLRQEVEPMLIVPIDCIPAWAPNMVYMKVNTADYASLKQSVTDVLKSIDPFMDAEPYFLDMEIEGMYKTDSQNTTLLSFFSVLAIIISLSGVFSLISMETKFKRKEVGVRKVFGASIQDILVLLNKTYIKVVMVCFILAVPLAWYTMQYWLQSYTVKVPMHWWVFALVLIGVGILTSLTISWLSYRTATENPVRVLRSE